MATGSVLFACTMNSIRSPMAAAILRARGAAAQSCGVYEGGADPFIEMILGEIGVVLGDHHARPFEAVDMAGIDVVIALTPEAAAEARGFIADDRIEFWDIPNPTDERGSRDQLLDAYRTARDALVRRVGALFGE